MSDRDRASTASPSLMEAGLKTLIGGRDSNYPLISGINGKFEESIQLGLFHVPASAVL